MKKEALRDLVEKAGDAVITYRSPESNKLKYNVCTLDFSTPHIKTKQNRAQETDDTILMYCWDIDAYRLLKSSQVTSVVPLANAIKESVNGK